MWGIARTFVNNTHNNNNNSNSKAAAAAAAANATARFATKAAAAGAEIPTPVPGLLPRFPEPNAGGLLRFLDYVGTVAFASSGALTASAAGMDALGCGIVGTITAVGGGTVRDFLLGVRGPCFWMAEAEYLYMCIATTAATFFLWPNISQSQMNPTAEAVIETGDFLGLGAFCVIGAHNGVRAGVPLVAAAICGMATATFGGVIRDTLCKRPVRILHSHQELYATCALAGATSYLVSRGAGLPTALNIFVGMGAAFALRYASMNYGLRLPTLSSSKRNLTVEPISVKKP